MDVLITLRAASPPHTLTISAPVGSPGPGEPSALGTPGSSSASLSSSITDRGWTVVILPRGERRSPYFGASPQLSPRCTGARRTCFGRQLEGNSRNRALLDGTSQCRFRAVPSRGRQSRTCSREGRRAGKWLRGLIFGLTRDLRRHRQFSKSLVSLSWSPSCWGSLSILFRSALLLRSRCRFRIFVGYPFVVVAGDAVS